MGPVMNLVLAIVVMAVVLYQGAPVPAFEQQPVVVGTLQDQSVVEGRRAPARRSASSLSTASRSTTWEAVLDGDRRQGQARA